MKEREPKKDTYWHHDVGIGEAQVAGGAYLLRLQVHEAVERSWERNEIVPITHDPRRGIPRIYFQARPCILIPDVTLTLGLYAQPTPTGALGEVVAADWEGMRHQPIGNAQAWYYPKDRTLVLWECFLEDRYRKPDPTTDETLAALWIGFERFLLERLTNVQQMFTPNSEPIYKAQGDRWQQFLAQQGYKPTNEQAFRKEVDGRP